MNHPWPSWLGLALLGGAAASAAAATPATRPNILWITIEDHSPHLGCYGDPLARTPNLDRLATQGVRFTQAFAVAGVCAPSRSALITGRYPNGYGSAPMRWKATLPAGLQPFTVALREAGYWATNRSKEDYNFATPTNAWDGTQSYQSKNSSWRQRPDSDQPFFAVFNFLETHESQHRNPTATLATDPALVPVPAYLPDTPAVRRDLARQRDLAANVDRQVGTILDNLAADGLEEDTIVFFFADHGDGLPRAKRWVYDSGLRVPLLVRIPEKWRQPGQGIPGSVDDRLISFVDLSATVLHLAGLPTVAGTPGQPFLGPDLPPPRPYIHGLRDRMDEALDTIRAVRDTRYLYVRNYRTWTLPYQRVEYGEVIATAQALRQAHRDGSLPPGARGLFGPGKPFEELYDTAHDPDQVVNLATCAEFDLIRARLSAEMDRWMTEVRDLGVLPEALLRREAARLGSESAVFAGSAGLERYRRVEAAARQAADPAGRRFVDWAARLGDPDPAIRYWGALGLGAFHDFAIPAEVEASLWPLLGDSSASVRTAAARALLNSSLQAEVLEALVGVLESGSELEQLEAASVLELAGTKAAPRLADLQAALQRASSHSYDYTQRVLQRVLQRLQSTETPAPSGALRYHRGGLEWIPSARGADLIQVSTDLRQWSPGWHEWSDLPEATTRFPDRWSISPRFFRLAEARP